MTETGDEAKHEHTTAVVRQGLVGNVVQVDTAGFELQRDDQVVIETDKGPELALVLMGSESSERRDNLRRVLRVATPQDLDTKQRDDMRREEALAFCNERIRWHRLPMNLVGVEFAHSGGRVSFYFGSAERVDFRALVRDLAKRFHTRIEMRQIGVRDAARHTGGLGSCGRSLCCASWITTFKPISIRMAKDQNLSLNHEKLSGVCGRLRCCLQYEQDLYREKRRTLPKLGKRTITPDGEGRVKDVNVLEGRVRVMLNNGTYADYDGADLKRPEEPQPRPRERSIREPAAAGDDANASTTSPAQEGQATAPKKRRRRRRRKKPPEGADS